MELSRDRFALSDLMGLRVRESGGAILGRVFEVRGHREGDGQIAIDELLIGRTGLWRRLRGPGPGRRGIPWESVIEIDTEFAVVAIAPQT